MCIIMTPRFEPKETLLVVAPLRTDPEQEQMWQLTYINSIDTPPGVPQGAAPLMVVPVPNAHSMGELDFTLFAVNERQAGDLRRDTDSLSRDYTPPPPGGGGQS